MRTMRVEVTYKFLGGILAVVGAIVFLDAIIPYLVPPGYEWLEQPVLIALAITVGLCFGYFFSKGFTHNVQAIHSTVQKIQNGCLTDHVVIHKSMITDETTEIAESLNGVVDGLSKLVGEIRQSSAKVAESAQGLSASSEQMSASANEVANTIEQVSKGAETQSEMVETASKAIKDVAVSTDIISSSANKLAESANQTVDTAQQGGETAKGAVTTIKHFLHEGEKNGEMIFSFGESVKKIGKIVDVITGISQKTNLLALNATIEAARAGEYGRGFAVVAEEIRKLADSTGDSAAEITELVETIRDGNLNIQESIKRTVVGMSEGTKAIDNIGSSFEEISQHAMMTRSKASSIVELATDQTAGAKNMVDAIDKIAEVTEDNAAATEEVSAASQEQSAAMEEMAHSALELNALSEELLNMVDYFNLGEDENITPIPTIDEMVEDREMSALLEEIGEDSFELGTIKEEG